MATAKEDFSDSKTMWLPCEEEGNLTLSDPHDFIQNERMELSGGLEDNGKGWW